MLLTVTSTTAPARDLGHLLRKHPDRLQSFELPFGRAHVFYPQADDERCTAAMLVEIDPVVLVRGRSTASGGGGLVDAYVNDRPYTASSFLSVAIARVFGAALAGRSAEPNLVSREMPLSVVVAPVRSRGADIPERLFRPLGYETTVDALGLSPAVNSGAYVSLALGKTTTLQKLLAHLYVLVPVLDDEKHYWVGEDEVEKLFRFGEAWLGNHPERELITRRYLRRAPALARAAVARLSALDDVTPSSTPAEGRTGREETLERPLRLQERRLAAVAGVIRESDAERVADVGCGDGDLLAELARDARLQRLVGIDVSVRELERAKERLARVPMHTRLRERIELFQSSALYFDRRLSGIDAIALVEVIEHIDERRLPSLERVIFAQLHAGLVVVTTPNAEYNACFPRLPAGTMRHPDHRFEWTRAEFDAWTQRVASDHGYGVRVVPVGDADPQLGAPTQLAVFECS